MGQGASVKYAPEPSPTSARTRVATTTNPMGRGSNPTPTPNPAPLPLMIITDPGADLDDEMALILSRHLVTLGHFEVWMIGRPHPFGPELDPSPHTNTE